MFFFKGTPSLSPYITSTKFPPKKSTITSFTLSVDQSNIRLSLAVCFLFDSFYVAMIGPAESDDEIEDEIEDANEDEVKVDDQIEYADDEDEGEDRSAPNKYQRANW